jgi:hypothetical protein
MADIFPTGSGLSNEALAAAQSAGRAQERTKELLQTWAYDTVTLSSATPFTSQTLFQTPTGTSGKTRTDTNMKGTGIFPGVQALTVRSIVITAFDSVSGTLLNTDMSLLGWGYFALIINDRPFPDYFQIKAASGGAGIVSASTTRGCWGSGEIGNVLSFNDPFLVTIQPNDPFRVDLNWDASVPLFANNSTELSVILYGRGTRRS